MIGLCVSSCPINKSKIQHFMDQSHFSEEIVIVMINTVAPLYNEVPRYRKKCSL